MLRKTLAALLTAALLAGGSVSAAQAATPTSAKVSSTPAVPLTGPQQVLALVNVHRAAAHLPPLASDPTLAAAAREWAQLMPIHPTLVHSTSAWRAARIPAGWTSNGENIAYGFPAADKVMAAWMTSPGHKANILNSSYTRIGVGYDVPNNRWVQIFAGYPADRRITTTAPKVTGTLAAGSTLTTTARGWSPAPKTFSYQWKRSGRVIPGATARLYRLVAADRGHRISVHVKGSLPGYVTGSRSSAVTPPAR